MIVYRWRAIDRKGVKYQGVMKAEDIREVANYLKNNYGYVVCIKKSRSWNFSKTMTKSGTINDEKRAFLFSKLGTMLDSGVNLLKALTVIRNKSEGVQRELCAALIAALEEGKSFALALSNCHKQFSEVAVKIVEAGEDSGTLSVTLTELAAYYRQKAEMRRFLINTGIYPCIVIFLALGIFGVFIGKVLPLFLELYASLGIKPAGIIAFLSVIAEFTDKAEGWLACIFLFFFGVLYIKRERIKESCLQLPLIKSCYCRIMEIRYCEILALLLKCGIAIPVALIAVGQTLEPETLRRKNAIAERALERGVSVSEALALNNDFISEESLEFVHIGEESGTLPEMLSEAALAAKRELQAAIEKFRACFEPFLLVFIAFLIGCIILSVAAPIAGMVTDMPDYL